MLDSTGRRMNLSANCIELLLSVAATTVDYLDSQTTEHKPKHLCFKVTPVAASIRRSKWPGIDKPNVL